MRLLVATLVQHGCLTSVCSNPLAGHLLGGVKMVLDCLNAQGCCVPHCRYVLVTPMVDEEWGRAVLVNCGWVPAAWTTDAQLRAGCEPAGKVASLLAVSPSPGGPGGCMQLDFPSPHLDSNRRSSQSMCWPVALCMSRKPCYVGTS